MAAELIGTVGAILLIAAWIPETYRTYKAKNVEAIDMKFLLLYVAALALLLIYSIAINAVVFIYLNIIMLVISLTETELVIRKRHARMYGRKGKRQLRPARHSKSRNTIRQTRAGLS